ncbi:MAG: DUF1815 family protein [Cyanobium sp.]
MFLRLAEQYRALARDLVMSLQALAEGLRRKGHVATCYVCGDELTHQGASFVADLGDRHTVRFLVSDSGISWVECRDGRELVRFEGAEAIQELQRVALLLQQPSEPVAHAPTAERKAGSRGSAARIAAPTV